MIEEEVGSLKIAPCEFSNHFAEFKNRFAELFGASLVVYCYPPPSHKFFLQLIYA